MMVRQGDILLVEVDAVPTDAKPVPRTGASVVIEYGEATGHRHQIRSREVEMFELAGNRYLEVRSPSELVHEEHATIQLRKGIYKIVRQREYVPRSPPRTVED